MAVFAHHTVFARNWLATGSWSANSRLIVAFGQGAVLVFFMITGYLFWAKALKARGKMDASALWIGRLRRLAPLYLLSAFLVLLAALPSLTSCSWRDRAGYVARLLMLGLLDWSHVPGLNQAILNGGVQWSLWFEWRFYLLLPFVVWFALGRRVFILCGLVVAYVLVAKAAFGTMGAGYWVAFLPGILATHFFQQERNRTAFVTPWAGAAALVWCMLVLSISRCGGTRWTLLALTPGFVVAAAGNTFFGVLTHPAIRLLGAASYSLYLLHCIILMAALRVLSLLIDLQRAGTALYLVIVATIGTLVVFACACTYRWIESPLMKKRPSPIRHRPEAENSSAPS
jgi:peptidoglycan/LPS O-acetylase OafA/YrhL